MERGSLERSPARGPFRGKAGLETPLSGRFARENRRLVFAPPVWYDALIVACLVTGLAVVAVGFLAPSYGLGQIYGFFVGTMISFAGAWGALSNERMACNLAARTYSRLEGQGVRKRLVQGSLDDLDALVLVAEELPVPIRGGRTVMYRLVLHWRNRIHPLLVVEREARALPSGAPINGCAEAMMRKGQGYAQALGIRFFDNSYYHSPCPVPVA